MDRRTDRDPNSSGDLDAWESPDQEPESDRSNDSIAAGSDQTPPSGPSSGEKVPRTFAERLASALRDGADADPENDVLQWLRALDLQVLGACRADERLKPLLKLNFSAGAAEVHLMSQLSQHFELSEVGMLVRCLCVPLVSIRVGKINKEGKLLVPINLRGHLNLTLLPSSDMRISFSGDDGSKEIVGVLDHDSEKPELIIEDISSDSSGRSFHFKLLGDQSCCFWCAEKSMHVGAELLEKMKSLIKKRPSLAQLTGICDSRLNSFASHLRSYLVGSINSTEKTSGTSSDNNLMTNTSTPCESDMNSQSTLFFSKPSRSRMNGLPGKVHPVYQSSLSPRSNTFKEGPSKAFSSSRIGLREKFRRRGDSDSFLFAANGDVVETSTTVSSISPSFSEVSFDKDKYNEAEKSFSPPFNVPDLIYPISSPSSVSPLSFHFPLPNLPAGSPSLFSPYYCMCPPCTSSFQQVVMPPGFSSLGSNPFPLPPISSSDVHIPFLQAIPPLKHAELSALDLPSLIPVSSFVTMSKSKQIPTFTPFMSDPIVHIPIIDVCSSGPGYLVSAGPAISSAIPPLLPNLVSPLRQETESVIEKNARETLRMLMASAPANPQMLKVLPAVLTSVDESFPYAPGRKNGFVTGSRGLYTGAQDVGAIAGNFCLMSLAPSPPFAPAMLGINLEGTKKAQQNEELKSDKNMQGKEERTRDSDHFG